MRDTRIRYPRDNQTAMHKARFSPRLNPNDLPDSDCLFDRWLTRQFRTLHGPGERDPLPERLQKLVDAFPSRDDDTCCHGKGHYGQREKPD